MAGEPLFYLVDIACLAVVGILMLGIGGYAKGGDFNRKYANRIMRWRIYAQFVAILVILFYVWMRHGG